MAVTGFVQRFKGKIKAHVIYLGAGGIVQSDGTVSPNLWTNAGAPVNGTSGTKAGLANPGDLLVDTTNKLTYQNTNTKASPTWTLFLSAAGSGSLMTDKFMILAPLPADLTTVVNAVTPSNVALTIAAQPPQARKLQIRIVIGTTTTTAITAGNLALIGMDQDGNAVTENISLIQNASATLKSAHAYASLTSATISAYAANGSGTGNTVGIGPSNDFGIPSAIGVTNFALLKSTKVITTVTGGVTAWSRAVTDDNAAGATVDAAARTVAPTTAPGVAGINDYEFTYSYNA